MTDSNSDTVKFGWRVPAFPVDGSRGAGFMRQISHTLGRIQGRFDSAWVADHFVPWSDVVPVETDSLEGWTEISYLAGAFPQLDFGNIVLCQSYRNPALLAKMGATLQMMTGGRFILGIGAGWKEDEYLAYGYDFPRPAVRIRQLEERCRSSGVCGPRRPLRTGGSTTGSRMPIASRSPNPGPLL